MAENGLLLPIIFIIASIVILYVGAEWSLCASEEIGERLGMPKLLVGLLLVGLGTSLPEFFVSHLACFRGRPEMAIANIIGSNLGNLFFILGLAGVLTPLSFQSWSIKKQGMNHLLLTILLLVFFQFSFFGPLAGAILLCLFVCFLYQLYREKKATGISRENRNHLTQLDMIRRLGLFCRLIGGFGLLYIGGELLVNGGIKIGKYFNISDHLVSIVLFSFATSFPELVTTVVACLRKKDFNLIIGNILGSNIFNIAFVLGTIGFKMTGMEKSYTVELTTLGVGALILFFFSLKKATFSILSGSLFMATYLGLVYYWANLG